MTLVAKLVVVEILGQRLKDFEIFCQSLLQNGFINKYSHQQCASVHLQHVPYKYLHALYHLDNLI